jgi:hypothetical protein
MSLEKAIQKLTNAITAAKMDSIQPFSQPSSVPGMRRIGDCPIDRFGQLDWKKLPKGACCYASTSQGCAVTCGGQGPGFRIVSEGPCPEDGVFTGDDLAGMQQAG